MHVSYQATHKYVIKGRGRKGGMEEKEERGKRVKGGEKGRGGRAGT